VKGDLTLTPLFEVLYALAEVVVGTTDEGVRLLELAVEIFPFLHMLNLDVHGETLGYKVQLVAKSFYQHAAVALGLINPRIHFIEPAVYALESPVDLLEPLVVPV